MNCEPVVVCASDAAYAMPLTVMMKSLLVNKRECCPVTFYVIDAGLADSDKDRLIESCSPEGVSIHWVPFKESEFLGLPSWGRIPLVTYSRLMIGNLLPVSLKKVIWLDCDLIVQEDVLRLWQYNLGDEALLAVQDLVIPYVSSAFGLRHYEKLGLAPQVKYFNAGVMVVNLEWWRLNSVTEKVLKYLRQNHKSVNFYDQDGLNAVLCQNWRELDPRWNQIAGVAGKGFFSVDHLTPESYRQVIADPWIIHFAGSWKPWNSLWGNQRRDLFFRYLDQTSWAGWRPPKTLWSTMWTFYFSGLRDVLYPLEHLGMILQRRFSPFHFRSRKFK